MRPRGYQLSLDSSQCLQKIKEKLPPCSGGWWVGGGWWVVVRLFDSRTDLVNISISLIFKQSIYNYLL